MLSNDQTCCTITPGASIYFCNELAVDVEIERMFLCYDGQPIDLLRSLFDRWTKFISNHLPRILG